MSHILALLDWLKNNTPKLPVYVHAIMDGRDTTDKAGKKIISEFEKKLSSHMKIASVMGRMYALDIHGHTSRVQRAVQSLLETEGIQASSAEELLEANYQKKIFDEEITPTIIHQDSTSEFGNIQAGDTVLFCNFEVLSLRALATALVQTTNNVTYLSLSPYNLESITPIFEAPPTSQSLGEIISAANYRQLRIADSDGYAFITAALDGGQEKAWPLEDYRLIQTPALDNYLEALLATQTIITKEVVKNVVEARYDFIALTFSGLDRLGQTGKQAELTTLMRALDNNIEKIVKTVLEHDGVVVIVGSHGLVEKIDLTSETVNHKRTTNPVPFILVGKPFAGLSLGFGEPVSGDFSSLPPAGTLLDVAPTILTLLGLSIPAEMTGKSLFTKEQLF